MMLQRTFASLGLVLLIASCAAPQKTAPSTAPAPKVEQPPAGERKPAPEWKTNAAALHIIEESEGLRLTAYRYAGQWLIGYGHSKDVKAGMTISQAQAEAFLKDDLRACEEAVAGAVTVPVTENEFGAMVSLCFNIGSQSFARSSVVRLLNPGNRAGAADAFLLWNKGTIGGVRQEIPHLTERRKKERNLFLK